MLTLLRWAFRRRCKTCKKRMTVESGTRGRWACPEHYYYGRPYMNKWEEFIYF